MRDLRIRWFVIVSILICSAYNIWPTYKYYFTNSISDDNINVADLSDLKSRAINLGLDLQGGMYVLLEVNVPELVLKIANKKSDQLIELINDSKQQSTQNQSSFFDELKTLSDERDEHIYQNGQI